MDMCLQVVCIFGAVLTLGLAYEITWERGGARFLSEDFGEYGNDVIPRPNNIPAESQPRRSWMDMDTILPNGTLLHYYLYAHNVSLATEQKVTEVRLQIWRPVVDSDREFMLAWQERIMVNTNFNQGVLYKVNLTNIHNPIHVYEGDRIGWGLQDIGIIPHDLKENHRTASYQEGDQRPEAQVGQVYDFGTLHFPFVFSVGVQVDNKFWEAVPMESTEAPTATTPITTEEPTQEVTTSPPTTEPRPTPTVKDDGGKLYPANRWHVYGPIIGVAAAAILGSVVVVTVYKWKQHQQKSVTPHFTV